MIGDIDVIAALGDSLTAASGASSMSIQDLLIENRGLSWSIGGQWNWRNASTLPNILKEFNPNLTGYSKRDSWTYHLDSQFNMAEIGASSADMPYMAKNLVQRIKHDRRINFKKSWKMVTIAIGGNDICSFICTMEEPESLPRKHKQRLMKTLRYLRDNLPRFRTHSILLLFLLLQLPIWTYLVSSTRYRVNYYLFICKVCGYYFPRAASMCLVFL